MDKKQFKLQHMPGHLIRRCHQISVAQFLKDCDRFQITPVQFSLLSALTVHPGVEHTTLTKLVAIDRSTLGGVVSRLEERGLLRVASDSKDRRVKNVFITNAGHGLLKQLRPLVEKSQKTLLAPLSQAEQETLCKLLNKIADTNNAISRVPVGS